MRYYCSITNKFYSQSTIDSKLSQCYRERHEFGENSVCTGCGAKAQDNSHTISQKRCKEIQKVCLIWDPRNIESLCRTCHRVWENGGEPAEDLFCYEDCMIFVQQHDPEGYNKRIYLK